MATSEPKLLDVLVGVYDNADDAKSDFTALRNLYQKLGASDEFDAAIVTKSPEGKVKIDKTYEAGTLHDALKGLGFGLAAGVVAALFPSVGIAVALLGVQRSALLSVTFRQGCDVRTSRKSAMRWTTRSTAWSSSMRPISPIR